MEQPGEIRSLPTFAHPHRCFWGETVLLVYDYDTS